MWIRCGCIHTKFLFLVPLFILSISAVYFCIELLQQLLYRSHNSKLVQRHSQSRRNPHIIIAQYIGTGNIFNQLPEDVVNQNKYSPRNGEGENGMPVAIPPREALQMQQLFKINSYNLLASDRIALNRSLPDIRKKKCLSRIYKNLPTTSIIIIFHNEAWSVLMRTVWSVINRSPKKLLKEIILVDDASNRTFLGEPLDKYVKTLPVVTKILRLNQRQGIISARLLGATNATGDVLTFLDAHCECTIGWLEPLLSRVNENPSNVVCPVIDIISDENFGYMKSFELHWGAFNWELHFRWYLMSSKELTKRQDDITQPFPSPAMAGGLFSINRNYFFDIGAYDRQMKPPWGGDNIEISFRIWQCGGRIEIIPCSHVGHLFRKSSPYTFPGGISNTLNVNLARTALVWMDDWAQFFIKYTHVPLDLVKFLDIEERKLLRERLHCKSFEWYLNHVWPDNFFPSSKRFFGKIIHTQTESELFTNYLSIIKGVDITQSYNWTYTGHYLNSNRQHFQSLRSMIRMFCLTIPPNHSSLHIPYGQVKAEVCRNGTSIHEMFVIREDGHIMANEGVCLDSLSDGKNISAVRMVNCADISRQLWSYNFKTQQIVQKSSNRCLVASNTTIDKFSRLDLKYLSNALDYNEANKLRVFAEPCSNSKLQKWMLFPFKWN